MPPKPLGTDTGELGTYSEGELADNDVQSSDSLSAIEPLSPHSLHAIRRLARYKPPPDPYSYPAGRAAVLVCLFGSRSGTNLNVLLSTRSEALRTYPGHVALPGGKMDAEDINLEATARREAFEEVGIPIDTTRIRYLTALPPFLVRSLTLVTPVVCFILDYSLKPDINPSEVSNLFSFPLEGFLVSSSTSPVFHKPTPTPTGPTDSIPSPPFHTFEDYPWFDGRPHRFHSFEARPKPITGLTAEILIHVASIAYGRPPEYELMAPGEMSQHELIDRATQSPTWSELRREKVREGRGEACAKGKL
ncbi:hypothetical protein JCM1841_003224 [Sporobolomyces salmonicolor]